MAKLSLGKMEKVELRKEWKDEAGVFTPWLAEEENINLLGVAIDVVLEVKEKEKDVGPFRADILCKDMNGNPVLIENQLERTDHTHLGQLMTYAAGLDAVTIIWIAASFAKEHRSAMDWLNRITNEDINFFGVTVELWKIGDSLAAPKFNVICKPDDWARDVKRSTSSKELSKTQKIQLAFWTAYKEYMDSNSFIKCQKPAPQHWNSNAIGRSGFHLSSIASFWDSEANVKSTELRVELVLESKDSDFFFTKLEKDKKQIEKEVGANLKWHNPPNKIMRRIYIRRSADIKNENDWPDQHKWLRENQEIFHNVFSTRIKEL